MVSPLQRAEHLFASPCHIHAIVLTDEQRVAALVASALTQAIVTLTRVVVNEGGGVYRSDSRALPVH